MMRAPLLLLAALSLLLAPGASFGQSSTPSLMQALRHADVIAETEIVEVRSRWVGGLVVTTVTAAVRDCIRGRCPSATVSYDVPGGEIDGVVQVVSGSSVPRVGHAMVLLLEEHPSGMRLVSQRIGQLPMGLSSEGERRVQLPRRSVTTLELRDLAQRAASHELP